MKIILFLFISFFFSLGVMFLVSVWVSWASRKRASLTERVRVSSVDDVTDLLYWRRTKLNSEERLRLWGDAMNILMTAESEELAVRYIDKVSEQLGETGSEFKKNALDLIAMRFHSESDVILGSSSSLINSAETAHVTK